MDSYSDQDLDGRRWAAFAMGPKLRQYLGITDGEYAGDSAPERTEEEAAEFTAFLDRYYQEHPSDDEEALVDLLDELVSMDLPEAVLRLAERGRDLWSGQDFRGQLSVGIAAMLKGDLELAEARLVEAQGLLPDEPAPYVNLAQIFLHQERLTDAMTWALAGLDADPNNLRLWDLVACTLQEEHGELFPEHLMRIARERNAWAGLALAADVTPTADRRLKLNLLEGLFAEGEREPGFLVELTAAYGVADEFDKIPALVWQAEKATKKPLPWQLHVHAAQAQLMLHRPAEALQHLEKAKKDERLDAAGKQVLQELEAFARDPTAELR